MQKSRIRRIGAGAAGLALLVTVTACGTQAPTATTAPSASTSASAAPTASAAVQHNAQDTTFAQMMIIHHEGALEMSELAIERAATPEVKSLAERISKAQGPEIEQMTSWLQAWGEQVTPSGHSGHDMAGMDMNGKSQEDVMAELGALSGTEFDKAFLEAMVAHHEGAVVMAQDQLAGGENEEAVALAEQIISDQEAEIAEMQDMLGKL